jgi:hypothetical protein
LNTFYSRFYELRIKGRIPKMHFVVEKGTPLPHIIKRLNIPGFLLKRIINILLPEPC